MGRNTLSSAPKHSQDDVSGRSQADRIKPATGNSMKAIVRTRFGPPDVLELKDVEKPSPNNPRGVLVKVHASSANPADYYQMSAPIIIRLAMRGGIRRPKDPRLGTDVSGRVESVSDGVTQFKPGDEVFGVADGSYAEYALAREDRLALRPGNCPFEEAGTVGVAGLTAPQGLRDKGTIQSGQRVLVNGAGGGVGTFAVQIAKSFGAEVTAVTNTENLEMVRSLGADHIIDYAKDDFTKNGQKYDLICDIAAAHSIGEYKRSLNPGGTLVIVGMKDKILARLLYFLILGRLWLKGGKKIRFFIARSNQNDLNFLRQLVEAGKLKPVIDRRYKLAETAEAMRHLKTGHARGKIVISVTDEAATEQETILDSLKN